MEKSEVFEWHKKFKGGRREDPNDGERVEFRRKTVRKIFTEHLEMR